MIITIRASKKKKKIRQEKEIKNEQKIIKKLSIDI
jgi:hypothetical protein